MMLHACTSDILDGTGHVTGNRYAVTSSQAKREETMRRRMDQMLKELEQGDVDMKMA